MLKFYFWVLKGPNCTKNFESPDLLFWRYKGSKFQLSHLRSPPYFAQSIIGWPPKTPESFVKVSRTVSEIFGILLSEPIAEIPWCLLQLLKESLDTPSQCTISLASHPFQNEIHSISHFDADHECDGQTDEQTDKWRHCETSCPVQ